MNGWNMAGSSSGSIPAPVSATSSTASPPSARSPTDTRPPESVNFDALLRRLLSTWQSRVRSPSTQMPGSGRSTVNCSAFSAIVACWSSMQLWTTSTSSSGSRVIWILPCEMRVVSSRSSISRERWRTCRSITAWARRARSLPGSVCWRISRLTVIGASGLRSSCASRPRNSFFRSSASASIAAWRRRSPL